MKRRRKVFISAFLVAGFLIYFCMVAINFQYVCDFQERAINDLSLQSKKSSKSSAGTSFCLQLYATLYTFCKEENMSLTQSLISNLSSTFDIPRKQLHFDKMMLTSGLPLFYCKLYESKNCFNSISPISGDHQYIFQQFPPNIFVIAALAHCNDFDNKDTDISNEVEGSALSWPILQLRRCDDLPHDDILHLIRSYHHVFSVQKFNLLCQSLHIVTITMKSDLVGYLKNNIPVNLHPQNGSYLAQIKRSRWKRAISKPSPGIAPPPLATPIIPTRASLYPPHVESTPLFVSVSPKTLKSTITKLATFNNNEKISGEKSSTLEKYS